MSLKAIAHRDIISGLWANPVNDLRYRILFSFTRNWGTYSLPFYEIKKNGNVLMDTG